MTENIPKTSRVYQHIRSFQKALQSYIKVVETSGNSIPLSRFLTAYFKENKQMGSKDRRTVSRYLYHYFRLGLDTSHTDLLNRLILAEFLCANESDLLLVERPDLAKQLDLSLEDKIEILEKQTDFRVESIFPWKEDLSKQLDYRQFCQQFLVQPDLFIRIRREKEARVKAFLDKNDVPFREVGESALAMPNGTTLEQMKEILGLYEVQDLSSQQSLEELAIKAEESWWDACSGAGGKSLSLIDREPTLNLLVSDIRPSILRNLDERFAAAGIKRYRRKILDLTRNTHTILGDETFDGILLDIPCSGSGTWGRTPEKLFTFSKESLKSFTALQRNIGDNVVRHLKSGAVLVYITCSVFTKENEEVVDYLLKQHGLTLLSMQYKEGYWEKADTLFVAILQKND